MVAILDIRTEPFLSNSESRCCLNATKQVSVQSDIWFGRCPLKNKKADMAAILDMAGNNFCSGSHQVLV